LMFIHLISFIRGCALSGPIFIRPAELDGIQQVFL
jgi:hypothetical protein